MVASKSNVTARKQMALGIMSKMREHSAVLVDQADVVSTELIRAAILWHEQWYDGLEEASKHYFADNDIPGMFAVLEPLHEMVEKANMVFLSTCDFIADGSGTRDVAGDIVRPELWA